MDFFQFEQASSRNTGIDHSPTTYDFSAISPTTPEPDNMFSSHRNSPPMHTNPGNVWNGPVQNAAMDNALGKFLSTYTGSVDQVYGQVTPPEDSDMQTISTSTAKRADSGVAGVEMNTTSSASPRSSTSKPRPSVRASQRSRRDSRLSDDDVIGDTKKEKYREKNRVAAAKCRAKKKEHVDHLEDNHRTQSALNTALKQTEKSLRDELSYWRTQALQHTFCNCHAIQDYNMQKAQSMAAGKGFGAHIASSSPSLTSGRSSSSVSYQGFRSQSVSGPEAASPVINESPNANANSFAAINAFGNMGKGSQTASPEMPFSIMSDLDLKNLGRSVVE